MAIDWNSINNSITGEGTQKTPTTTTVKKKNGVDWNKINSTFTPVKTEEYKNDFSNSCPIKLVDTTTKKTSSNEGFFQKMYNWFKEPFETVANDTKPLRDNISKAISESGSINPLMPQVAYAPADEQDAARLKEEYEGSKLGMYNKAEKMITGSFIKGVTNNLLSPEVPVPETTFQKIVSGVSEVAGAAYTIGGISGAVGKGLASISAIDKLAKTSSIVAKALPFLQGAVGFAAYGQLDPNVENRSKKAVEDVVMSVPYTALGFIPKAIGLGGFKLPGELASIPAAFGLGYGISKLEGASDEDAYIQGGILAAVDGLARGKGRLSGSKTGRYSSIDETMAIKELKSKALEKLNQFAGTKLTEKSTAEEIKQAYYKAAQTTHPDKTGGSDTNFKILNNAYQFLTGESKTLDNSSPETASQKLLGSENKTALDLQKEFETRLTEQQKLSSQARKNNPTNIITENKTPAEVKKEIDKATPIISIVPADTVKKIEGIKTSLFSPDDISTKTPADLQQRWLDSYGKFDQEIKTPLMNEINGLKQQLESLKGQRNPTAKSQIETQIEERMKSITAAENEIQEDHINFGLAVADYAVKRAQAKGLNLGEYSNPMEKLSDDWQEFRDEVVDHLFDTAYIESNFHVQSDKIIDALINRKLGIKPAEEKIDTSVSDKVRKMEELEKNLDTKDGEERQKIVDESNKLRDEFNKFADKNREVAATVPFKGRRYPIASVEVLKLKDGDWQVSIDANVGDSGMSSPFYGHYNSIEGAIKDGKRAIVDYVGKELSSQKNSRGQTEGNAILKSFKGKTTDKPKAKTKIQLISEGKIAEEQAKILMEIENAKAGERIRTVDPDGTEHWSGVPSSFPKWVPEELRSRKLFDTVLGHINNDTIPTKANEVRLYNAIADRLGLIKAAEEIANKEEIDVAALFADEKTDDQISTISGQKEGRVETKAEKQSELQEDDRGGEEKISEKSYEQLESESYKYATENTEALIKEYEQKEGNFFGGDNIKGTLFPEYSKNKTNYLAFRKAGDFLWHKIFDHWLVNKRGKANNMVMILIGGPAVGKTVSARAIYGKDFLDRYSFVMEVTGQDKKLLDSTVEKINDNGFLVDVVQIYTNIDKAFDRMLDRAQSNGGLNDGKGRTVYIPEFVKRNIGSIEVGQIYSKELNQPGGNKYKFLINEGTLEEVKELDPKVSLDFLSNLGYNKNSEEQLINKFYGKAIQSRSAGTISEDVFRGTTGLSGTIGERTQAEHRISGQSPETGDKGQGSDVLKEKTTTKKPPVSDKPEGGFNLERRFGGSNPPSVGKSRSQKKAEKASSAYWNRQLDPLPKKKTDGIGSGEASVGRYADGTPIIMGGTQNIMPVEMPELVELTRELTGKFPAINDRLKTSHGRFMHKDQSIQLNPEIFKDAGQAVKTLAHEIGHLTDWVPDGFTKRRSLLQKLYILKNHISAEFGGEEVKNSAVKDELWELSSYWRPVESASERYMKYRKSGKELYADAISVLFNSPGLLEQKAPTFYKAFFASLDKKPEINEAYWGIQDLLHGAKDELYQARESRIKTGFVRAADLQRQFEEKRNAGEKNLLTKLKIQLDDRNVAMNKKVGEAEKEGKIVSPEENPRNVLQELAYMQNDNFLLVEEMDAKITKPLKEAGMNDEDMGIYLALNRISTERADIANPWGFDAKNAIDQLSYLKKRVGEKNFALLQDKAAEFHNIIFRSVEEGAKVGSINKEVFEKKLAPNKGNYAAFAVVDHLTDHVSGTIKKQIGTFKEIQNPYYSTILKTAALNNLNNIQRAKNVTINFLKTNFAGEIKPTQKIGDQRHPYFKPAEGREALEVLEDGRMTAYDIDPYIAESFKSDDYSQLNVVVKMLGKFNDTFKSIVTTYNPGFAIAFNPKRDFSRTYKAIPNASIFGLAKAYKDAYPSSRRFAKGQLDDTTRKMLAEKMIGIPQASYSYDPNGDEMGMIARRYGMKNDGSKASRLFFFKPVVSILAGMREISNTFESISKIAGANLRKEAGESGKTLSYNVRNYTGTPNYKVRGTHTMYTNEIFIFSNIMKEGMKSDWNLMKNPKTAGGYWWKTAKIDLFPKALMAAAALGLLGSLLKDFFDKVTEYDKTNYLIIPLGWYDTDVKSFGLMGISDQDYQGKKAVYMRIPHDETGRQISAFFWKATTASNRKQDLMPFLGDVFSLGAGQLPQVTPAASIIDNWTQFMSGKNPYDRFRGRSVIDDTTFAAGGLPATQKMIEWTTNAYGLSSFSTYDPSRDTTLESTIKLLPGVNRLIKISDYGETEQQNAVQQISDKQRAIELLQEKDVIGNYAVKYRQGKDSFDFEAEAENAILDILGHEPETEDEQSRADNIRNKFTKEIIKDAGSSRFKSVAYATRNKEKVELLKGYKNKMSAKEFSDMLDEMIDKKLISDEVYYQVSD
jgi:hypothetical protein